MFYVHGIQGQVFSGPLERLDRVIGLARTRPVRPVGIEDQDFAVEAPLLRRREEAVKAYRQMVSPDIERGPLYHADQVMSRPVITVASGSQVADAWRILRDNRIRQAPVVNEDQRLVGVVSERDLLTAIDVEDGEIVAARRRRVSDVMTTPVVAADPITDIRRIAAAMLENGVDGVPVVAETGRLLGFISRSDILKAVVTDPPLSLWR